MWFSTFFCGSLLVHLCLVAGVCCLYSGIRISLFHLLEILIPDLFWLLCILLIFGSVPSDSRASTHLWVDSQPNLFSLRCFSHLSCRWLLLLLPLVSVVGSSPSTLSIVGSLPSKISVVGSSPSTILSRLSKYLEFSRSSRYLLFIFFKLDLYDI
jgi:hypothetical protein